MWSRGELRIRLSFPSETISKVWKSYHIDLGKYAFTDLVPVCHRRDRKYDTRLFNYDALIRELVSALAFLKNRAH